MNGRSQVLRNTLFSSVGLYTEYVLGMLTSIVIARHLEPAGFGTYSLVVWLVGMGVATTNSGTASAAIKFIAELRGSGQAASIPVLLDYLRRAQRGFMAVVLLAGAAVFVFAGDRVAPNMNHALLLAFLAAAVALRSSYMLNIGIAKGFENFRATAIVALVSTPLNLLLVLAAWWADAGVEWLLGIFVVSSLVFFAMSRWQIARLMPARVAGAALAPALMQRIRRHMWLTALIVTIGFFVASEVEVLFLNLFSESGAAGEFKVAYQLATGAALLVPGVFAAILLPMMAGALSQGRAEAGRRFVASTSYLALLALPLVAFGVVFSGDIIGVLYGRSYAAAAPVFALCLAATGIAAVTQGASSLLVSADRQGSVLVRVIVVGLFKVLLDIVLIRHYGLLGAAVAYFVGATIASATTMVLALRITDIAMDWGRLARIALCALLAGLAVWPLQGRLPPLAAVLVGGACLGATYLLATLLLRCWTRGDIEYLQHLHQRSVAGRPLAGARLLEWARRHAAPTGLAGDVP